MVSANILVVDDESEICDFIRRTLIKKGYEVTICSDPRKVLQLDRDCHFDLILVDYRMPHIDGLELFYLLQEEGLLEETEMIMITGQGDYDLGISVVNKGFYDYISKPFNIEDLYFRVRRALDNLAVRHKVRVLSRTQSKGFGDIIGNSDPMQKVYKTIKKVADKDITVLIQGETGTGKELVARALFEHSGRKSGVFIPVNCGAIAENLLESELFGHEKGAFTGAVGKKHGIFEAANKGTVFLDEIGNASSGIQQKLLRVIESGEFIRVGSSRPNKCEVRIIAATNDNLYALVKKGEFREDLYHRLNLVHIQLPPLRERKGDVALLVEHYLEIFNRKFNKKVKILKTALQSLESFSWSGNVRQLRNLMESMILLNEEGRIRNSDLPEMILEDRVFPSDPSAIKPFKDVKAKLISDFEKKYLRNILRVTGGNVSKASELSELNRKHLIDKLALYDIDASFFKKKKVRKI